MAIRDLLLLVCCNVLVLDKNQSHGSRNGPQQNHLAADKRRRNSNALENTVDFGWEYMAGRRLLLLGAPSWLAEHSFVDLKSINLLPFWISIVNKVLC